MSAHTINHLLGAYGCALVFSVVALQALGAPLPGTTVLVAAALLAASHHTLPILGVIAAGASGAFIGTAVGFAAGRWGGERIMDAVVRRRRADARRIAALRAELGQSGGAWLFFARFITGLRNIAGLLAGASGMTARRFVAITAAAAVTWALVNSLEYYWFGRALAGADTWVQVVLVCLGLIWVALSLRFIGRRALRRISASSPPA